MTKPERHRPYAKLPEDKDERAILRRYEREQRGAQRAALVKVKGEGRRIVQDWLGYRFIKLTDGRVLFRRQFTPTGIEKGKYSDDR